ncbi:MAG: lysophospholipid acyltransferase family protein [Pyrinomonadaceae bacterium]
MSNTRNNSNKPPLSVFRLCRLIGWVVSKILWGIRFEGIENIPGRTPHGLLIASNHQTYFDPVWITIPLSRPVYYLAWSKAFAWPLIGRMIAYLGAIPVDLDSPTSFSSVRNAIKLLRKGEGVVIFPEAEREFADGQPLPFKTGVAALSKKTMSPILPVTISGGNEIWPQGNAFPTLGSVKILYHPMIYPEKFSSQEELAKALENAISK